MERHLKFRAWDGDEMHYNIVPWRWDFVISLGWHKCERSTGAGNFGSGGKEGDFLVPGVRFKELMQFTGLKDKNGREIYEGDWCSAMFREVNGIQVIQGKIIMDDYMWCIDCTGCVGNDIFSINRPHGFEVIGNIYESPELLNQNKK